MRLLRSKSSNKKSEEDSWLGNIPALGSGQRLSVKALRDPYENSYLMIIWLANLFVLFTLILIAYYAIAIFLVIISYAALISLLLFFSWKLTYWFIYGHGIAVGPTQYPQIYRVVKAASEYLDIPMPTIIVLQGHGLFELLVAKRFTRRGIIILTSNMMDEFSRKQSSREFMMYVGRQLGHLKAGHFRLWFFKDVIGLFALFFHS